MIIENNVCQSDKLSDFCNIRGSVILFFGVNGEAKKKLLIGNTVKWY